MTVKSVPVVLLLVTLVSSTVWAAPVTQEIKLDYFGYRPNDTKIAIFTADPGSTVQVRNTSDSVVYTVPTDGGSITSMGADGQPTGDDVWQVDFSGFTTAGSYRLYVPSWGEQSYDFDLAENVYNEVGKVALKTYYYQRCGVAHLEPYADERWADPNVCHGYLTAVTAASGEPDYGTLDLSGGWHDAGDYNKYVWGDLELAIEMLLLGYENSPDVFFDGQLNIPESGNGIPDLLDEVKVEIDWLLKMQMPGGEVLSRVWDNYGGAPDPCPPSNAVNPHYYYGPDLQAGAVFTGCVAKFARICAAEGDPYGNVATLQQAATNCWNNYLLGQGDSDLKCWAAAELWRLDQSITSARDYVEGYLSKSWSGFWPYGYHAIFHAALAYMETPGANSTIVNNMMNGFSGSVNQHFDARGPYRDSMFDWAYHWGSNKCRGSWGVFMTEAARLGATGSHSAAECMDLAQDYLHAFHGQNPMRMVYLTNMADYGGEHSSYQFFHSWFGTPSDAQSAAWYIGLPPGVTEPDFPYFKGTDNFGVSDDNYSDSGPCPGFVVGGPNKDYGGTAEPPKGETYYERFYRDWCDDSWQGGSGAQTWEITENSIAYQGPYVALVAAFMSSGGDTTPPAAPTGLSATAAGPSQIDLDWDDNTEPDLGSYRVYRSTTSGGDYTQVATVYGASSHQDTGLSPSTTYYYVVTAVDTSSNESGYSNEASATTEPPDTTPPAAPTGLVATAISSSQIDLDWDDNTEPDLDSYNVYRDTVQIATDVASSSYSDTGLSASTQYCYTVTAVDTSSNESAESDQACATTLGVEDTMHVDSIAVVWGPISKSYAQAYATVVVVDSGGAPVEGATVYGTFSGSLSESGSGTTDDTGTVEIVSEAWVKQNRSPIATFCVDDVQHASLLYDPDDNVETCDSTP